MNANRRPLASLLLTAIASLAVHSHACAQQPLTRAEVIAELQAATRSGDVLAAGDSGMKLNERSPRRYAAAPAIAGKTCDEVRAETLEAIRAGDILAPGDSGLKLNEMYPQRYAYTSRQDRPVAVSAAPASGRAAR